MAKRSKKDRKQKGGYQRSFTDDDFAWLAEQYQKQVAQNPDLTLEEFAIGYGVEPKWIRSFINTGWNKEFKNTITVWHGTTVDRAKAIMADGFKAQGGATKKIWFTQRSNEARGIAARRSQSRGEAPAVFSCQINIGKYTEFDKPRPHHYAFRHSHIDKAIISSVSGLQREKEVKQVRKKRAQGELVDVMITKTSGKFGVLLWVNSYLEQGGGALVSEDHPTVEAIFK
ncbi:MAG: hypothetical protein O7E52_13175, partial [Candidatus Poribacteria bacterium]|nr:hypothetical protein [Candidatus Poribacteria bacterium]